MYPDDKHRTFAANTVLNIDRNLNEDLTRVTSVTIGLLQISSLLMHLKLT